MVAFEAFGVPVYRYGIFYGVTFLWGYLLLWWLGRQAYFAVYPKVQRILTDGLDDLMLSILLGVILGGRLGHVFLYQAPYYLQNPLEIARIDQGGMSFIGGVIGVIVALLFIKFIRKLSWKDLLLLGDIILSIVPIGILLGRIGNYLNQELRGKTLSSLSERWQTVFRELNLVTVYETVDQQPRVFTNAIESSLEGFLLLIVTNVVLFMRYCRHKIQPGLITGLFFAIYAIVRFFVEFFKDMPASEYWGTLSITQWVMFIFFVVGVGVFWKASRSKINTQ